MSDKKPLRLKAPFAVLYLDPLGNTNLEWLPLTKESGREQALEAVHAKMESGDYMRARLLNVNELLDIQRDAR